MIENTVTGHGVKILFPDLVNVYGCAIGDNSIIGPFVEIQRGAVIGKMCKIESHSFICDRVTIGDYVFIGHGVMFTNDRYPLIQEDVAFEFANVGDYASIGSGATIGAGVQIGEGAIIGAGAVVVHNVPAFAIVVGNPARILRQFNTMIERNDYVSARQHCIATSGQSTDCAGVHIDANYYQLSR